MYRFMRVMVMFDLPILTAKERREYARFRRYLLKSGFQMIQESVYGKICLNGSGVRSTTDSIKANKPSGGLVQVLTVTERQYSRMIYIVGEPKRDLINDDRRTVIL